MKKMYRSKQAD